MRRKRKRKRGLTKGDLNRIVDAIFHPLAEKDGKYLFADVMSHVLVEQDLSVSLKKFCRYTLPKLLESAVDTSAKRRRRRQRRKRDNRG